MTKSEYGIMGGEYGIMWGEYWITGGQYGFMRGEYGIMGGEYGGYCILASHDSIFTRVSQFTFFLDLSLYLLGNHVSINTRAESEKNIFLSPKLAQGCIKL